MQLPQTEGAGGEQRGHARGLGTGLETGRPQAMGQLRCSSGRKVDAPHRPLGTQRGLCIQNEKIPGPDTAVCAAQKNEATSNTYAAACCFFVIARMVEHYNLGQVSQPAQATP